MDDFDHSIHIAEYDWTSFYEESEECSLPQPSLACLDNLSLSDSENSEISSPVFSTSQQEIQQSPDVNSDGAASSDAGCRTEGESCIKLLVQVNTSATGGEQVDVTGRAEQGSVTQVECEICLVCPAGNTLNTKELHMKTAENREETTDNITNTSQTELSHVQCSEVSKELKKGDGDMQIETDHSRNEPDSVLLHHTELNLNEPRTTQEAGRENVSSVVSRAEKEHWFVTVNDSPVRQRAVKKKQRQKKLCRNMCSSKQEQSVENGFKINRGKNESEGGGDMKRFTQSNPNLMQNSGGLPSAAKNPECTTDSSQMLCEEGKVSEKLSHSPKKHITGPTMDRNTHELASSNVPREPFRSHDTFTPKDSSQMETMESDESEDSVDFFSVHSYDSENYLSAAEAVDECAHPLTDHLIENQQISLTTSHLLNAEDKHDGEIHSCDSTFSCNVSATNCDGCESTSVESTLAFPSASQRANKMPDDNSTCDNNARSTGRCRPSDTLTPQKQEINLLASGGSSGHKLSPLPVPDLTGTPCSVADGPETYARAAGHSGPVYAISAFWDEMEKLTINDILQLRISSSTLPEETRETLTPNADDAPSNHSFLADTMEYNLSVGGLMDTSDAADSDYFTQPDECKPDCPSCEVSTSDFEEYWQFIGASRNQSPDPQGKTQQKMCDSPLLSQEESLSTCSEGKETPVPLEDLTGWCLEDQESHTLRKVSWPMQITKSKTMHNVQTLNTEDLSLQSLFGDDESNLFLSRCQSLDENLVLKVTNSSETLIPAPVLSGTDILDNHYQISIPEVFEYFFTEDKANNDSRFVTTYDPEDMSMDSVCDCTHCSFREGISFSSLYDSQQSEGKPIPIFSCSHPTVRELTFPKLDYVFLNADCDKEDISPIRVVSCAFTQPSDCGAGGSCSWKSLLAMRKICFHNKGSVWCRSSGAWVFPVELEKTSVKRKDPPVAILTEGRVSSAPTQLFRELALQQRILETISTRTEGIFSTLKQSDMCLVCIAFASWVLRSSDPEAADTWRAALLANVSALSAIQFLREYVKKKNPLPDDP